MYQHGLIAAFFALKAAEVQHLEFAILKGCSNYAKTPKSVLDSLDYRDTLPESSFGNFLRIMHFKIESEESVKEETNETLCDRIINASDESRDKRKRDAGRAPCTSTRKPLMEHPKTEGDQL